MRPHVALLVLAGAVLIAAALVVTGSGGEAAPRPPVPEQPGGLGGVEPSDGPGERPARPASQGRGDAERRRGAQELPQRLRRALSDREPVVLALFQSGGRDDAATRNRLRNAAPRLAGEVRVVTDGIGNLDRYASVVSPLGISQAPAIVVISPDREARLIEGFTNRRSLRQLVADALR